MSNLSFCCVFCHVQKEEESLFCPCLAEGSSLFTTSIKGEGHACLPACPSLLFLEPLLQAVCPSPCPTCHAARHGGCLSLSAAKLAGGQPPEEAGEEETTHHYHHHQTRSQACTERARMSHPGEGEGLVRSAQATRSRRTSV